MYCICMNVNAKRTHASEKLPYQSCLVVPVTYSISWAFNNLSVWGTSGL